MRPATVQEYRLRRDGLPPLTFQGEMVLERSNRWVSGREKTRWHVVRVYRTLRGRWVLEVVYRTLWQGELDSHQVRVLDDLEGLRQAVEDLVPEDLRGEVFEDLDLEDRIE